MDSNNQDTSKLNEQTFSQQTETLQEEKEQVTLLPENLNINEGEEVVDKTSTPQPNIDVLFQKPENSNPVIANRKSMDKVMYVGIIFMVLSVLIALALYFRQQIH